MTTPKKIADLAGWVIEQNGDLSCPLLKAIGYWHEDLGTVARTIDILEDLAPGSHRRPIAEVRLATRLMAIAAQADAMLRSLGVEDPAALFAAEYERAAVKHPGMTLDCDGPTDENRFYALAEEVGGGVRRPHLRQQGRHGPQRRPHLGGHPGRGTRPRLAHPLPGRPPSMTAIQQLQTALDDYDDEELMLIIEDADLDDVRYLRDLAQEAVDIAEEYEYHLERVEES